MRRRTDSQAVRGAMAAYVDWKEQCFAVRDSYSRWGSARQADARVAYLAYAAAVDREARASEAYADMVRRAEPRASSNRLAA
jgi:hypothetical protein